MACIVTSHGEAEFWEANSSGRNQHGLAAIDKTPLRRRHDHRILARHLIGEGGHAEALLHQEKNFEIGQGGFHHHDADAFRYIERNSRRASLFGRVHLIDARDSTRA
jgi:hypothetical protein